MSHLVKLLAIGILQSAWHFGLEKSLNLTNTSDSSSKPPPVQTIQKASQIFRILFYLMKYLRWTHSTIEILIILFPVTLAHYFLPMGKDADCIYLSPFSFLAVTLITCGAVLRITCFREMGKQFTYDVTIVENHKLVTTGPYNIVRHPSYTGAYCLYIGQVLWCISRGSWLKESGVYKVKAAWLLLLPAIWFTGSACLMFKRRIPVEDAAMERNFGKEWKKWASEVPYRLVPGIY